MSTDAKISNGSTTAASLLFTARKIEDRDSQKALSTANCC